MEYIFLIIILSTHLYIGAANTLNNRISHDFPYSYIASDAIWDYSLAEWIKENMNIEILFPIIADTGLIAEKLGLIHPGKGTNTVRAVFVVDAEAKIRIILYYPQELGRNMDEILRVVKAMQISDKNKVAMPANWPNNEVVGDHVIIPPPTDTKTAKERLEKAKASEFECLDWWLCHKKLGK